MKTFTRAPLNGNLCAEKGKLEILIRKLLKGTHPNADLKISLYIQIHIKIIPREFRILSRKNSGVIHP